MKKYNWILGLVVLAIIFIAILAFHNKPNQSSNAPVQQNNQPAAQNPQANVPAKPQPLSSKTQGQLYTDAVNTYQYRLQFSACHGSVSGSAGVANGGTLVIKKGAKFMIDNRDAAPHTFAFKGQSYKIGGYNFAIVSANATGTYPLTCDGGGGATLNVQG